MKQLLTIAVIGLCAVVSNAQGLINFANSSGSKVFFEGGAEVASTDGFTATLWEAAIPEGGTAADVDPSTMVQIGSGNVGFIGATPVAGRIGAGTVATGFAEGTIAAFQVRVTGIVGADAYEGQSAILTRNVGGASGSTTPASSLTTIPSPNPNNLTALGVINVSMAAVPEPSVIVLGMVGAGLLWFRRKK